MQLNTTRTSTVADNGKQFVDHGVFDAVYNLGTGIGVALWGTSCNKHVDWDVQPLWKRALDYVSRHLVLLFAFMRSCDHDHRRSGTCTEKSEGLPRLGGSTT